jgi:hypothetical protein
MKLRCLIFIATALGVLSGCSYFQQDPQSSHNAICKELKYRMVNYSSIMSAQDDMNSQVNQPSAGWQQTAEMVRLRKSYHEHGCD